MLQKKRYRTNADRYGVGLSEWVGAQDGFIQADIIRWTEGIWKKRGRSKRAVRIGDRQIVAEVLSGPDKQGWNQLLVRGCKTDMQQVGAAPADIKNGSTITRKKETLLRGQLQRLTWSDESARSIVVSKFLNEIPQQSAETGTKRQRFRRKPR